MFADFAGVCFDQIANELAKYRYMTGGQVNRARDDPTGQRRRRRIRGTALAGGRELVSERPGLKICVPGTPADAYGLLRAAIRDPDPVLVFEHKGLLGVHGPMRENEGVPDIGVAEIIRPGQHATVVVTQLMRQRTLDAADALALDGIELEVIDLRTLVPFDARTVGESVQRTSRLVCVQECQNFGSWGASVAAHVLESQFDYLDGPPHLIGGDETPIPFAQNLEEAWIPSADRITGEIKRVLGE